jgi:hypothetical protein
MIASSRRYMFIPVKFSGETNHVQRANKTFQLPQKDVCMPFSFWNNAQAVIAPLLFEEYNHLFQSSMPRPVTTRVNGI